jgi:hypothetical protein
MSSQLSSLGSRPASDMCSWAIRLEASSFAPMRRGTQNRPPVSSSSIPQSSGSRLPRSACALLQGGRQLSRIGALLAHVGVVRACLTLVTGCAPGAPRRFVRISGPTAARTLERLVGEVRKLPADVHPVVQALWCQPKCFQAMAEHLSVLERDRASIAGVMSPREISSGDQPPEALAAHRMLAEASAGGRHLTAARSTHWVQFDEPELIVSVVKDLCQRFELGLGSRGRGYRSNPTDSIDGMSLADSNGIEKRRRSSGVCRDVPDRSGRGRLSD